MNPEFIIRVTGDDDLPDQSAPTEHHGGSETHVAPPPSSTPPPTQPPRQDREQSVQATARSMQDRYGDAALQKAVEKQADLAAQLEKMSPVLRQSASQAVKDLDGVIQRLEAEKKAKGATEPPPVARQEPEPEMPPAEKKAKGATEPPPVARQEPEPEMPPAEKKAKGATEPPPVARQEPEPEMPPAEKKAKGATEPPPVARQEPEPEIPPARQTPSAPPGPVEQPKADIFNQEPKIVTNPERRFSKEQWEALGPDAHAQMNMMPPVGMENPPTRSGPGGGGGGPGPGPSSPPRGDREPFLDWRRRKIDIRTEQEMREHGSPENMANADRQRKDEDYVVKQDKAQDRLDQKKDDRARKEKARHEERQRRDEDYVVKQEKAQDRLDQKKDDRARKEKVRHEERQRRDEDYVAKRDARDQKQAEFDPYAEAAKKRDKAIRQEQVKSAYEEHHGDDKPKKSGLDVAMDVAKSMRGTLGGTFGPLVGMGLDMVAAWKKMQPAPKSDLRKEAEELNKRHQQGKKEEPTVVYPVPNATRAEDVPFAKPVEPVNSPLGPERRQEETQNEPQSDPSSILGKAKRGYDAFRKLSKPQEMPPATKTAASTPKPPVAQQAAGGEAAGAAEGAGAAAGAAGVGEATGGAALGVAAGLAEIAGPVGDVVAAAYVAAGALKTVATSAVKAAGNFAASAITLQDGAPRIEQMGQGISSLSDKLFYVNPALGILGSVAGQAVTSVGTFDRALKGTVEQLAKYDGRLASQVAGQQVAEIMRDIKRANQFGGDLANANKSRFEMEQKMADITDKFIPLFSKIGEGVFSIVGDILIVIEPFADIAIELLTEILSLLKDTFGGSFHAGVTAGLKLIANSIKDLKPSEDPNDANDALWAAFIGMANGAADNWMAEPPNAVMPGGAPGPVIVQ